MNFEVVLLEMKLMCIGYYYEVNFISLKKRFYRIKRVGISYIKNILFNSEILVDRMNRRKRCRFITKDLKFIFYYF